MFDLLRQCHMRNWVRRGVAYKHGRLVVGENFVYGTFPVVKSLTRDLCESNSCA